jgi:hypothetical protein
MVISRAGLISEIMPAKYYDANHLLCMHTILVYFSNFRLPIISTYGFGI